MTVLITIHHSPYGGEHAFNALRLARTLLAEQSDARIHLFLLSDGVTCALPNQLRPDGSYNIEEMLRGLIADGAVVKVCMTCADHRGLFTLPLLEGVQVGSMSELAAWVVQADRVMTF